MLDVLTTAFGAGKTQTKITTLAKFTSKFGKISLKDQHIIIAHATHLAFLCNNDTVPAPHAHIPHSVLDGGRQ